MTQQVGTIGPYSQKGSGTTIEPTAQVMPALGRCTCAEGAGGPHPTGTSVAWKGPSRSWTQTITVSVHVHKAQLPVALAGLSEQHSPSHVSGSARCYLATGTRLVAVPEELRSKTARYLALASSSTDQAEA